MKKSLFTLLVLGAVAISANAAVMVAPTIGEAYADNSGSSYLAVKSLVAFIVDVDGDGFGDWNTTSLTGTGFTIDDDDILLGIGSSGGTEGWIVGTYTWNNAPVLTYREKNGKLNLAEEEFKRAILADADYGQAHNNLGKVYYKQKKWYQAAWEFEYARQKMVGNPAR